MTAPVNKIATAYEHDPRYPATDDTPLSEEDARQHFPAVWSAMLDGTADLEDLELLRRAASIVRFPCLRDEVIQWLAQLGDDEALYLLQHTDGSGFLCDQEPCAQWE